MDTNPGIKFIAYQVSENIHIKKFKSDFIGELLYSTNYELFYHIDQKSYAYVLNYGVVVFANYNDVGISQFLNLVKKNSDTILEKPYREDFVLYEEPDKELTFTHTSLSVPKVNDDVIRVTMLYVGQSVSVDYYAGLSQLLLSEMSRLTNDLERFGKLKISKKNLLKVIGKTLNVNNGIIDNLYIIDPPEIAWENEYLDKISTGLVATFDLKQRFREVEYTLKVTENNLNIFISLLQNKESTTLEWIIIALILFEVVNAIIDKFI